MAPLLLPVLLHALLLLLLAVADALPPSCSESEVVTCAGLVVRYPFRLDSSASHCGYPGLDLVCEDNATLILPVKSHRYRVFRIDYTAHTVVVSDADADEYAVGCPRLRVNLTIDTASSWLQLTQSDSNVTFFYNCKKNISWSSAVELIGCRQDGKTSYALPDGWITGAEAYEYECEEVVVAPVLGAHKKVIAGAPGSPPPGIGSFAELLQGGFELNYDTHSQLCDGCERSGGWCGYRHNQTNGGMNFTCFCDGGPATARCDFSPSRLAQLMRDGLDTNTRHGSHPFIILDKKEWSVWKSTEIVPSRGTLLRLDQPKA
ncbi:hypothetical protein C2845_PM07G19400 [Panicum miliaceum]|uniref:Wall-associated receptor kinase galacturonan-binding domain-containing protein n=1 Tax=Panicum miliaceum TaxID=4540 RepID=A0A3L6SLD4_PANMI|nr:hypothetical protein C2845_PM07G19400 [Panicum miliaceum]